MEFPRKVNRTLWDEWFGTPTHFPEWRASQTAKWNQNRYNDDDLLRVLFTFGLKNDRKRILKSNGYSINLKRKPIDNRSWHSLNCHVSQQTVIWYSYNFKAWYLKLVSLMTNFKKMLFTIWRFKRLFSHWKKQNSSLSILELAVIFLLKCHN